MPESQYSRIRSSPAFHELTTRRSHLAWVLCAAVLIPYYCLILVAAFQPTLLHTPLAAGMVTTVGWPIGAAIIVGAWLLTGLYVRRANTDFETLNDKILQGVRAMTPAVLKMVLGALLIALPGGRPGGAGDRGCDREAAAQPDRHRHVLRLRAGTLGITYWAASRTKSAADFYTAGGGITGLPERPGDRRRLHVGRHPARPVQPGVRQGLSTASSTPSASSSAGRSSCS